MAQPRDGACLRVNDLSKLSPRLHFRYLPRLGLICLRGV